MIDLVATLDRLHFRAKQNRWLRYFARFNRVALAAGFLPSGFVKILGERFTSLSVNHPMGHYLEALFHTGYYYTFIGVLQMMSAVLLLIPPTATLGAVLYFPIILNICLLSLSVRFEGSLLSSPLMVLANLYLLCWDYDKLKYILPFHQAPVAETTSKPPVPDKKFPVAFFAGVTTTIILLVLVLTNVYSIMPRNTLSDCNSQCSNSKNPEACRQFCDCIHIQGKPLDKCLDDYERATASPAGSPSPTEVQRSNRPSVR
ncbi:DoxX family protein [Larkinella soli]|uniref:DoxX family protein n=1 Tax=Larkinella soli TaxID=1770527 RepID=UPI000FFBE6F9|nr:DoxX family protein [Larkinella soli]